MTEAWWKLDAVGLAERVKAGDVSPVELVDAAIARIEALDGPLNAVVYKAYEQARERARSSTLPAGPFQGVPMLAKNSLAPAGMPHDRSCAYLAGTGMVEEWPFNQAVADTGAIWLGETNSPELGLLGSTEPRMFGATANPWDLRLSPGGSSGGSSAAIAAGMVPIATAGDGAGSIRIPAAHCGLVGLKVSRGRDIGSDTEFLTNLGCISRSVRDTAVFAAATQTPHPVGASMIEAHPAALTRRLKIAFSVAGHHGKDPDPGVAEATRRSAALLEELGHDVVERPISEPDGVYWHHFLTLWSLEPACLVSRAQGEGIGDLEAHFEPWALGLARLFRQERKAEDVEAAYAYFRGFGRRVRRFLQEFDVFMSPVLSSPPIPTGEQSAFVEFEELNRRLERYVAYTPMANLAGIPSLSLPLNWSDDGLPIGTLFNADYGQENRLLSLALELEQARPWGDRWPAMALDSDH